MDKFRHYVRIQKSRFVDIVPLIEAPDEFVATYGDGVQGGIGDRNPTYTNIVEFDQGWTSLQVAKSTGHDGHHRGCVGINVTGVPGGEGGCRKSTDGCFSSGNDLIFHV